MSKKTIKHKKRIPSTGPDMVLSMRRGRTFADKKKQANKWACRKSKGV